MNKLIASLAAFLLILTGTIYLYYRHWHSEYQAAVAMPHVPASAVFVYETDDIAQQWQRFKRTAIAQDLKQLPCITMVQSMFNDARNLSEDKAALAGVPLIVSAHPMGEGRVGWLFYFNTHHAGTQNFLGKLLANTCKDKVDDQQIRKINGYKTVTLRKVGSQPQLFYLKQAHYLVFSTSSLLIEGLAASLSDHTPTQPLSLRKSRSQQNVLHINFKQLPELLLEYLHEKAMPGSMHWAKTGLFAIQLADHHWLLSGYLHHPLASAPHIIRTLNSQQAGSMAATPYIPQRTALVQHYTFSDPGKLAKTLPSVPSVHHSATPVQGSLTASLNSLLAGEIAHCTLTTGGNDALASQLLLIRVSDAQEALSILQHTRAISAAPALGSNVYAVSSEALQPWLPSQIFANFHACYLVALGDYIILANSQKAWQQWQHAYTHKQTWAHHAGHSAWLANTLDQAHVSYFVNVAQLWPTLMSMLRPRWQQVIASHANTLQKLAHGSLQLLDSQEAGCYVNLMVKHKNTLNASRKNLAASMHLSTCFKARYTFRTEVPIAAGPFIVKSHRGQGLYLLLQDIQHRVYFLDPAGKLLWKRALDGPVTTPVFEIDFYKNHKVQYLLATDKQLHLLDYYGRNVTQYPRLLPTKDLFQLNVVDYDGNKNYRFLLATAQGDIYLYNKNYHALAGWDPKSLRKPFIGTPFHIRVRDRDYFVALQKPGSIHVFNRRGAYCQGFPISLEAAVKSPLWVQKGPSTAQTRLSMLMQGGYRLTLSLLGTLEERTLIPQANETSLIVCPERWVGKQYVMLRPGDRHMAVLDQAGNLLFDKPHGAQQLQYYALTVGKSLYVATDTVKRLTYIYDSQGNALHTQPLPGCHVAMAHHPKTKKVFLYSCFEQHCHQYKLDDHGK